MLTHLLMIDAGMTFAVSFILVFANDMTSRDI